MTSFYYIYTAQDLKSISSKSCLAKISIAFSVTGGQLPSSADNSILTCT
jgi:hypothetical protein